jgi:hypothetical protein
MPPPRHHPNQTSRIGLSSRWAQYIAPTVQRPESLVRRGVNLVIAHLMYFKFQVYVRQDTPPVEEFIWSMPRPSAGQKHPPVPPRFEPLLHMLPTPLTSPEPPPAMQASLSPALKSANALSLTRMPKTSAVDNLMVSFDYNNLLLFMQSTELELRTWWYPQGNERDEPAQ